MKRLLTPPGQVTVSGGLRPIGIGFTSCGPILMSGENLIFVNECLGV
ncbi:hypothetical protein [Anaerobaca lacustris]|uniref:Uncharacterized protein n=1 Tax=Anaerobaca lacustris TaxID=3044600 RepID=A0AAW6U1I4_9BACT|nr:hypothetical protein [Sedimentisphaerales bacterium M17dextr]